MLISPEGESLCLHGYRRDTDPILCLSKVRSNPGATMFYPTPIVWTGTWRNPSGLHFNGFHVWDRKGRWVGVYRTYSRAQAEARR